MRYMKKIIIGIFLLVIVNQVNAQLSIGIKGGTSFASIKKMESANASSTSDNNRTAFVLGAYATLSLSEKLKIQPEVLYQGMGGSINNVVFENNYVSVPILLKYGLTNSFYLEAGPQFSILSSSTSAGMDIKDKFTSSDFQVLIGASLNLTNKIGVGVRYGMGMSNIASNAYKSIINTDIKNNAFMVMLSYKLL